MLKCRDIVERGSDFIDQDMTLVQQLEFRVHLMMCRRCRTFVGNLRKVVLLLHRAPEDTVPADLMVRLDTVIVKKLRQAEDRD